MAYYSILHLLLPCALCLHVRTPSLGAHPAAPRCSIILGAPAVPSTTLLQRATGLAESGRVCVTSLANSGLAAVQGLAPRVAPALASTWAIVLRPPVAAALVVALVVALVQLLRRNGSSSSSADKSKISTPEWAKPTQKATKTSASSPSLFRRKKEEPPAEAPNPFLELGAALGGVALETASLAASAALAAVSDSATDAETSEVETATQEEEASDEAATEDEEATADADETEEVEVEASSPAKKGSKSLSQAWDDLFGFEAKE